MALVVEDGTGLSNADALISRAAATTYHAAMGNTAWASATTDNQDIAIRVATAYMTGRYGRRLTGQRVSSTQALDFPRLSMPRRDYPSLFYASNAVPTAVANACAELALRALSETLNPDTGQAVVRERMAPIEVEYESGASSRSPYAAVDALMEPFLAGAAMINLERT